MRVTDEDLKRPDVAVEMTGETWGRLPDDIRRMFEWYQLGGRILDARNTRTGEHVEIRRYVLAAYRFDEIEAALNRYAKTESE